MDNIASGVSGVRAAHSDEEVILAASRPKKKAGRRVFKETRHPVYRGVRRRNNDKWVCELREPGKQSRIWVGTNSKAEMAARAHDVAALALRGRPACLNFEDSAWRLPAPASTDAKDIRAAAAKAAEAVQPKSECSGASASGERVEVELGGEGNMLASVLYGWKCLACQVFLLTWQKGYFSLHQLLDI